MASQFLIQPAAEMHARILIIISCHERSVSAAKCAKRYPAGFPSMARVGINLRKYVNQISIKIHKKNIIGEHVVINTNLRYIPALQVVQKSGPHICYIIGYMQLEIIPDQIY